MIEFILKALEILDDDAPTGRVARRTFDWPALPRVEEFIPFDDYPAYIDSTEHPLNNDFNERLPIVTVSILPREFEKLASDARWEIIALPPSAE